MRIFIRREKARIRRGLLGLKEQKTKIDELYKKIVGSQKKVVQPVSK